jgi:hypothetical protein
MLLGMPSVAKSPDAIDVQLVGLDEDFIIWEGHTRMQLSGVSIYVKAFVSSQSASKVAHALGQRTNMFQRVLAARGIIVLSGVQPDWHWLAEVQPTATGSKGYISALRYDARTRYRRPVGDSPYPWLPANARRYVTHTSHVGGSASKASTQTLTQQIYAIPQSGPKLKAYIGMRLRQEGWTNSEPFTAYGGSGRWHRDKARLFLFVYQHAGGTSLFMQHLE